MSEKHFTFEEFLKEKHGDQYMGLDDNMPDAFDAWIADLDNEELIKYAEEYGLLIRKMNTKI